MIPTDEQAQAMALFMQGQDLKIEALAGTGKTTLLHMLATEAARQGRRMLYTSFGRQAIIEARHRFAALPGIHVSTNHALAYRAKGAVLQSQGRLVSRMDPDRIIHQLGWNAAHFPAEAGSVRRATHLVLRTLAQYLHSDAFGVALEHALPVIAEEIPSHTGDESLAQALAERAEQLWFAICEDDSAIAVTHDVYLKLWALEEPHLDYDIILLDEAQDSSGLLVGLLARQEHAQRVICGDRWQQIYGFRGAVNAMDRFANIPSTVLTHSFRFGPAIAQAANAVLTQHLDAAKHIVGRAPLPDGLEPTSRADATISRTNATSITALVQAQMQDPWADYAVIGGTTAMLKALEAVDDLMRGRPAQHPEFAGLTDWRHACEEAKKPMYRHLAPLVRLVDTHGIATLKEHLKMAAGNENHLERCASVFVTAHKAKGLEWPSVQLTDDFRWPDPQGEGGVWTAEEGRLLYVAMTRAKANLDIQHCRAARHALQGAAAVPAAPEDLAF